MTLADAGRGGAPESPRDLQGTWLGDEIQRAQARIEALTHSLEAVQGGLRLQHEEVARFTELLQTVDGRTQRHEAGQESVREARHLMAGLEAALEAEASLRRDLAARVERGDHRDNETQRELQRVLAQIASRLDEFDGRHASIAEREHHLSEEFAEQEREDESVEGRLAALERRAAADQESARHTGTEIARAAGAVPELLARIDDLAGRVRAMQADQRRLDEDVVALRAIRDREEALLDVLEQQRATRARMEDRLNRVEEAIETVRRAQTEAAEGLSLLTREQAGEVEQRRRLVERIEAQRDVFTAHLRRSLRVDEESAQRHIEEIEREVRAARGLLVRLDEQTGEAEQEQPL